MSLVTKPVTVVLAGEEIVIESTYTFLKGKGTLEIKRKLLKAPKGEVTFEEYITAGYGNNEYQQDMSTVKLRVDDQEMPYDYKGKKIEVAHAKVAEVIIPDIQTKVSMCGEDVDSLDVEEGIAFSPIFRIAAKKALKEGEFTTWLNLAKAD